MDIGIIVSRPSPVFVAAASLLEARGLTADLIMAGRMRALPEPHPLHDLYIIKSGRSSAVTLAGLLHARGARCWPPYPLVAEHRNKILVADRLKAAGMPVPESFTTTDIDAVAELLPPGPVLLKPFSGSRGEGIIKITTPADLEAVPPYGDEPWLVQRYIPPDHGGSYLAVYRIGEELFGLRRRWPAPQQADTLFELPAELVRVAEACGRIFDIDLYGVDIVMSGGAPFVVDMSLHAGFVGVPDAARRVADYMERVRTQLKARD